MNTKVVPFNPVVKGKQTAAKVPAEMEQLINEHAVDGWEFYNFYTSETLIAGSAGCFGIGAKPSYSINVGFVVFKRQTNEVSPADNN